MTTRRPSAVVFDMGGVLTEDPFSALDEYAAELQLPERELSDWLRNSAEFRAVERGELAVRDFLKAVCTGVEGRHGVRVDIHRLATAVAAAKTVRHDMVELLHELHAQGLRLGLVTNNAVEGREWWKSGVFPLHLLDVVVDSSEVGVRKPDPEIFEIALGRLATPPGDTVFIDDLEENVSGAEAVGMRGVRFESSEQCRRELVRMGIPVHLA